MFFSHNERLIDSDQRLRITIQICNVHIFCFTPRRQSFIQDRHIRPIHPRNLTDKIFLEHISDVYKRIFEVYYIARSLCLRADNEPKARSTHNTPLLHRIESDQHHSFNHLFS